MSGRRTGSWARSGTSGQAGATLVEVLVVLSILAVLAGAAVLGVARWADSRPVSCLVDKEQVEGAVHRYQAVTGYLPSNQGRLVPDYLEQQSARWNYTAPDDLIDGVPEFTPTPECQSGAVD